MVHLYCKCQKTSNSFFCKLSVAICFLKNGEKICFQKNKQLRQIFGCGLIKKWNRKEFLQIQIAALLKAVFYISKILWVFLEHWKIIRIKSSIFQNYKKKQRKFVLILQYLYWFCFLKTYREKLKKQTLSGHLQVENHAWWGEMGQNGFIFQKNRFCLITGDM